MPCSPGSAYLANVHFRHVKALQPSFPGIAAMLRLLDAADVQESLMRSETSMEVGWEESAGAVVL